MVSHISLWYDGHSRLRVFILVLFKSCGIYVNDAREISLPAGVTGPSRTTSPPTVRHSQYATMSAMLTTSRRVCTLSSLPKIYVPHLRAAHNGTTASRTVAALASSAPPSTSTSTSTSTQPSTHFRVTLRRSGISLGKRVQGTLAALGLRRRMQTVYHAHTPEAAGMILSVKELVEVENVPASAVRTAGQQRAERKAPRGFVVVGSKVPSQ